MRNFVLGAVTMAVLLIATQRAQAESQYIVWGVGTVSCGKFTQEYAASTNNNASNSYYMEINWIAGFVSAENGENAAMESKNPGMKNKIGSYGYDLIKGRDVDGLLAWVNGYCLKNPLDDISQASLALVTYLTNKNAEIESHIR